MHYLQELYYRERIQELLRIKTDNTTLLLFGNNAYAPIIIGFLAEYHLHIETIFDNRKAGDSLDGISIILPQEVSVYPNAIILIASKYFDEMSEQLLQLGYRKEQIFRFFNEESFTFKQDFLDPLYFKICTRLAFRGEQIYDHILSTVHDDAHILLSPLACIGDIYLMCLNLNAYLEKNKISEYVIAAPGKAACELARRFGHANVYRLTKEESDDLILFYLMVGEQDSRLHIFNGFSLYTSPFRHVFGCSGMTWFDHYNRFLYRLDEEQRMFPTSLGLPQDKYAQLLADGFAEGNTVILSPYAHSIRIFGIAFWESLAMALQTYGYVVYTNVSPTEEAIKGTRRLDIPLEYMDDLLEKAGTLIAMRSGFCDVTSQAHCRRIILYPADPWFGGSTIEGLSLNRMGLCQNAFEYVATEQVQEDIAVICNYLEVNHATDKQSKLS